ncbi:MAG: hypothetical protein ACI9MR_004459 [Myxococcota bacterium]|jgi:hypothetical protein
MRCHITTSIIAMACLAGCGGKADPSPAKPAVTAKATPDPNAEAANAAEKAAVEKIASAALTAYRDKDITRLAELGPPSAGERTIFIEPRNPNYERLLGDSTWRMRSLKAWDGELKGFRIGEGAAQVKFGEHPDNPKQVVAVELLKTEGAWRFHDLVEQDRSLYNNNKLVITLPPELQKKLEKKPE